MITTESKTIQSLSLLKEHLSQNWHAAVDALADSTLQSNGPLRLILAGAFSVGKSSLLNMLIGQHLLQTALEETTALPTFIEYGAERVMQLVGTDRSVSTLDEAGFARATTQAPDGAACAVLALPLDWLQGVSIIDLPGLGSTSSANRDYTAAQIQQADAILYLIAPSGPGANDVATLREIRRYGKRVKIVVTRWDQVEDAVASGEKMPPLEQWAKQIEAESDIKARIAPVSKAGLGREELLDFICRARDDVAAIRLRRFNAELRPLLENAIGQNADAQQACEAQSAEKIRALHTELMQRKQALLELKSSSHEQSQQDRAHIDARSTDLISRSRDALDARLKQLADFVQEESHWDDFGNKGAEVLRTALADAAIALSAVSEGYGQLQLPDAQVLAFNLRMPPAESVETQDFLDMARLSQLQSELDNRQADFKAKENALALLPAVDVDATQRALQALIHERHQVASQPLPQSVQRISPGGAGLGRMIGEIADIGLLFVNPAIVGAKIASLIGKSTKVVKVAKMANMTAKIVQGVGKVAKDGKIAQAAQLGRESGGRLQQAVDKLGMLEMLSLGYWGERVGTMLSGSSREEIIADSEAQAQQQQVLSAMDAQVRAARNELARMEDIANEQQLTGWMLEQNSKDQQSIKENLKALTLQAEKKQQEFDKDLCVERQQMLQRYVERALAQWLNNFDQQTSSMKELLRVRVRSYWENRVDALIDERVIETESLARQFNAVPADKEASLARLQQDAAGLQTALGALA